MKTCSRCGQSKPVEEFHARKDRATGRASHCRACDKVRTTSYRATHREVLRHGQRRRWTGADISRDEIAAMEAAQGGVCAICGRGPEHSAYGVLHLDHCHSTGRVRGLLCDGCNKAIGHFGDDPARLRAALSYLTTDRRPGSTNDEGLPS